MNIARGSAVVVAVLGLLGCGKQASAPAAGGAAPLYTLACRSSNTATRAEVYCVRTDTRNGDILRVDYTKLPVTNGPTASAAGPAGRYQTECTATETDQRSDFYCVRLNTESGEMMLINLTKVGQIPASP